MQQIKLVCSKLKLNYIQGKKYNIIIILELRPLTQNNPKNLLQKIDYAFNQIIFKLR